jgi:hypothetical protein
LSYHEWNQLDQGISLINYALNSQWFQCKTAKTTSLTR